MNRWGASYGGVAALVALLVSFTASAAGPAKHRTVSVMSPQTASIAQGTLSTVQSQPATPINLNIDTFKAELQPAPSVNASLVSASTPAPAFPDDSTQDARFAPLLKQTDHAEDPNNRGDFMEKHEFGIQLLSSFN